METMEAQLEHYPVLGSLMDPRHSFRHPNEPDWIVELRVRVKFFPFVTGGQEGRLPGEMYAWGVRLEQVQGADHCFHIARWPD